MKTENIGKEEEGSTEKERNDIVQQEGNGMFTYMEKKNVCIMYIFTIQQTRVEYKLCIMC